MFFNVFQVPWRSCFFIATCLPLEILLSSSGCLSKGMAFKRIHLSNRQPKNLSGREDDDNLMKWFSTWNKLGNISSLYYIYIYIYISSLYERLGEILYNAMICHGSIKCASVMVWKRPLRSPMPQAALQSSHPMSKNCKTPIFWGCLNHLISRWPANVSFCKNSSWWLTKAARPKHFGNAQI